MASSRGQQPDDSALLVAAMEAENSRAVLKWIHSREFWLVTNEEDSDDEATAAMMAEVDDVPVIVAFTNEEAAVSFAQSIGHESFSGFVVGGDALVQSLGEDIGILLDAETERCCVIPPDLLA